MSETPSYPAAQPSGPLAKLSGGTLLWIQVVGGLLAAISTFMEWFKIEGLPSFFGAAGLDTAGNGWDDNAFLAFLILVLGLAIAVWAFVTVRGIQTPVKLPPWAPVAAAAALLLFTLIRLFQVLGDVSDFNDAAEGSGAEASTSYGLWILLIASLVTLGAALLPMLQARKTA